MQEANSHVQRASLTARRAVKAKDWTQVRECAREILNRQKNNAEGRFLLGLAEKASNRREQAIKAFSTAIDLDATRYDAAVELAELYLYRSRFGEAVALLQKIESLMDNSPLYLDKAATIYTNVGLPERAWPLYKKANELQPGVDLLRAHMAACNVYVGKIDEAKNIYADLLQKHPDHQRNHYELSRLGRATDMAHVEQMKQVLQTKKLKPELNIFLYYAIGKELEDLEQWDEAFDYYKKAGDAARSVADYDVNDDIRLIDKIIEVCDRNWLQDAVEEVAAAEADKVPFFVVGLPRSGTTLTERILSSHSSVESAGESFLLKSVIKQESGVRGTDSMSPEIIEAAAKKAISRIGEGYLQAVDYKLSGKPFFVEKLPENVFYLGFIAKAYPQARIVLLKRNPMDNCFALYKQSYFRYAYSFDDLGPFYVAYNRLYEHWRELLKDRLIEIEYESLVSDQAAETRKLLEQAGLEFEEACLNFEKNKTASNTASTVQIREKVHTRSVYRWKRFEKQLQLLKSHLQGAGIETG